MHLVYQGSSWPLLQSDYKLKGITKREPKNKTANSFTYELKVMIQVNLMFSTQCLTLERKRELTFIMLHSRKVFRGVCISLPFSKLGQRTSSSYTLGFAFTKRAIPSPEDSDCNFWGQWGSSVFNPFIQSTLSNLNFSPTIALASHSPNGIGANQLLPRLQHPWPSKKWGH